jgi:hypothetical protein
MSDIHTLVEIGLAIALALAVDYGVARWIRRMLIVRAVDRIANAYSTEQALGRASKVLRHELERYRRPKQVSAHRERRTPPLRSW